MRFGGVCRSGARPRHHQGRRPALAVRNDGDQRNRAQGRDADGNRGNQREGDRKSTRLNSSHLGISYAVFCLKKKKKKKKKNDDYDSHRKLRVSTDRGCASALLKRDMLD